MRYNKVNLKRRKIFFFPNRIANNKKIRKRNNIKKSYIREIKY